MSEQENTRAALGEDVNLDLGANSASRISFFKALFSLHFQDMSIVQRVYICTGFAVFMYAFAAIFIVATYFLQTWEQQSIDLPALRAVNSASNQAMTEFLEFDSMLYSLIELKGEVNTERALETLNDFRQSVAALEDQIKALPKSSIKDGLLSCDIAFLKDLGSGYEAFFSQSGTGSDGSLSFEALQSGAVQQAIAQDPFYAVNVLKELMIKTSEGIFKQDAVAGELLDKAVYIMGIGLIVLLVAVFLILWSIRQSLRVNTVSLLRALQKIAKGDLNVTVEVNSRDEIGNIATLVNGFVGGTRTTLTIVAKDIEQLYGMVSSNRRAVDFTNEAISMQKSKAQTVASATSLMEERVEKVAEFAKSTLDEVKNAEEASETCRMTMSDNITTTHALSDRLRASSEAVGAIDKMGDKIESIVKTIADIADQTNLLALNATIEAARAGKYGRGFAIVAEETRELANKTAASTKEVSKTIGDLREAVGNSVAVMGMCEEQMVNSLFQSSKANSSIEEIMGIIATISDMSEQIVQSCHEQAVSASEINQSLENISSLIDTSYNSMQGIHESMGMLDKLASKQAMVIRQFKLE